MGVTASGPSTPPLLLDTHALLWWLDGDERLGAAARELIAVTDREVLVSAASAWEITTKHRLGKLPLAAAVAADVSACLAGQGFTPLSITMGDAERAGRLPGPHRDPFDRMLIAQALSRDLVIISNDAAFDDYAVRRTW